MTGDEVKKKISELEALRSQARLWRIGTTCAIVLIMVLCVGSLVNSVHNLFRPGPAQDQFTSTLTTDLKRDVLPNVQTLATQAITDSKPQVETAFSKLNGRVPELTERFAQAAGTASAQSAGARGQSAERDLWRHAQKA